MEQQLNNHVMGPTGVHNMSAYSDRFKMSDKTTATNYTASGLTALWGMVTIDHIVAVIGVIICIATFVVNVYFKRKEDRRQEELHAKLMEASPNNECIPK